MVAKKRRKARVDNESHLPDSITSKFNSVFANMALAGIEMLFTVRQGLLVAGATADETKEIDDIFQRLRQLSARANRSVARVRDAQRHEAARRLSILFRTTRGPALKGLIDDLLKDYRPAEGDDESASEDLELALPTKAPEVEVFEVGMGDVAKLLQKSPADLLAACSAQLDAIDAYGPTKAATQVVASLTGVSARTVERGVGQGALLRYVEQIEYGRDIGSHRTPGDTPSRRALVLTRELEKEIDAFFGDDADQNPDEANPVK